MREHQVAGELETFMREMGAEDNFQLMSASQHNRLVHQPTNRILEMGDILLGEITPAVEGRLRTSMDSLIVRRVFPAAAPTRRGPRGGGQGD